jgi:hypothetical protein
VVKAKKNNTKAVKAPVGSPNRSRDNSGQQPEEATSGMAALHLPDADADKLLERRRIRIGWNLIHGLLRIRQTLIDSQRKSRRQKKAEAYLPAQQVPREAARRT